MRRFSASLTCGALAGTRRAQLCVSPGARGIRGGFKTLRQGRDLNLGEWSNHGAIRGKGSAPPPLVGFVRKGWLRHVTPGESSWFEDPQATRYLNDTILLSVSWWPFDVAPCLPGGFCGPTPRDLNTLTRQRVKPRLLP